MFPGKSWIFALCVLIYVNRADARSVKASGNSTGDAEAVADGNGCTVTVNADTEGLLIIDGGGSGSVMTVACAEGYALVGGDPTVQMTCEEFNKAVSQTTINHEKTVPNCVPEVDCKAEVYFVLDRSESIDTVAEAMFMKNFVDGLVDTFNLPSGAIQAGLITYNSSPTVAVALGTETDPTDFKASVPGTLGVDGTQTGKAIELCDQMLAPSGTNVRPGVSRFCIVVTDGRSGDAVSGPATQAKSNGIIMMAVGVAGADQAELDTIASEDPSTGEKYAWTDPNVPIDEIADHIAEIIC